MTRMFGTHDSAVELAFTEFPSMQTSDRGPRTPVVILHGILGSGQNWRGIAQKAEISRDQRVFTVDLRNHGRSPHSARMDLRAMAEDLDLFLEQKGLTDCTLLGHSLGGKVAMATALAFPSRIQKLIVADIAPVNYETRDMPATAVLKALRAVELDSASSRGDVDKLLQASIPDKGLRSWVLQNLNPRDAEGNPNLSWKANLPVLQQCLPSIHQTDWNGLAKESYTGPTLFVGGGKSKYIREQDHAAMRALFPRAQIQTIKKAGHWLHHTHPQEFTDIVSKFMREQ